jgi:hypothetical protein
MQNVALGNNDIAVPNRHRRWLIPVVGLITLLAAKIGVLAVFGPTMQPDTAGYLAYADAIINGNFLHVDTSRATTIFLARPIGYPAIIAAAQLTAGNSWTWVIVVLQIALSLIATCFVYRLARTFELSVWACLAVAGAQATGIQFPLDQTILSDSLSASAMTVATCILGSAILRKQTNVVAFAIAGTLIVVAFLLRDAVLYLAVGLLPLAAAAAAVERNWFRRAIAFGLVLLPLLMVQQAYLQWNKWRAGTSVVGIMSQLALFHALVEASQFAPSMFEGSDSFDQTVRQALKTPNGEANALDLLHQKLGWDAARIGREVTGAYAIAWLRHPIAMLHAPARNLSETQLHQAVRPTETVRDILLWNTGSDHDFARERAVRENRWMIFAIIAHRLSEVLSVVIFAAFLLLTPARLWRDGLTPQSLASAGLWIAYLECDLMFVFVAFTPRYIAGVVAGSIVVGAANIAWVATKYGWLKRPAATHMSQKSSRT